MAADVCQDDTNAESKDEDLGRVASNEVGDNFVESCIRLLAEMTISSDLVKKSLLCSLHVSQELLLKLGDLGGVDFVEESSDSAVDDGHLLLDGHGDVLTLLQQLSKSDTSVEELLGGSIKIRTKLGEGSDLATEKYFINTEAGNVVSTTHLSVLSQLQLHGTSHLLHGLGLSSGSDTRHRQTNVDGWSDTWTKKRLKYLSSRRVK